MRFNAIGAPGLGSDKGARQIGRGRQNRNRHCRARRRFFQPTFEKLEQRVLLAALAARPYDLTPLAFARNEGQLAAEVAYAACGVDFSLSLTPSRAVLGLNGSTFPAGAGTGGDPWQGLSGFGDQPGVPATTEILVQMSWLNGREAVTVEGVNQLPGVTNYVWGDDPSAWHAGIASFERVRYDEVYDGIDLEFYGRGGEIEFDWIVAPHVDPSQITMVYAGMDDLSLDAGGNLVITAASQQIVQHAPFVYQVIAGQQRQVAGSYQLGDGATVQFALGEYDPSVPLVIDPVLSYSTYLGGSSNETAADIAADAEGNTYVIGTTGSDTIAGEDAGPGVFITKFKPDGQIEYVTTLGPTPRDDVGGFRQSVGQAVAIGPGGLPYVVFLSIEGEYLTYTSTHQLHLSMLDADGIPVFDMVVPVPDDVSPTAPYGHLPPYYVGVGGFAVDNVGDAYVTYETIRPIRTADGGTGFPETEAFITKVDSAGEVEFTELLPVLPRAIAVDAEHNIYLTATTDLEDLFVSDNAFQPQRNDAPPHVSDYSYDVYVAMLNPTATGSLAGTYVGGSYIDIAGGIAVNPNQPGVVYLAGTTQSPDFPLQKNPYQQHLNNSVAGLNYMYDGFITVLDLVNMELLASTFLGGSIDHQNPGLGGNGQDVLSDIALDEAGNVYVVGETNSLDFPVANPLLSTYTVGPNLTFYAPPFYDFVIAKFDANLSALAFSTYFGGSGQDSAGYFLDPLFTGTSTGPRLAVDAAGTMHVAGTSKGRVWDFYGSGEGVPTDDFPVLNAAQPNFGGGHLTNYLWDGAGASDAVVFAIAQRGTLAGRGFSATQGREFNHIVAGFTSFRQNASAGDFTATIDWGDGTTSNGNVRRRDSGGSVFLVEGIHEYSKPGAFPVVVQVEDHSSAGLSPITNIDVSHWEDSQTGGSIAADATHPHRLFAAMTDHQGESRAATITDGGILVATSTDAGATWSPRLVGGATDTTLPPAKRNPDVLFDKFGNLFLAYEGSEGNNIVVAWSTDGGKSFVAENGHELVPEGTVAGAGVSSVGSPKLAFNEFNNEVWITFEDVVNDRILVAAAGVSGLGDVGSFHLQPISGSTGGLFSDIAVGPDGSVAVAWQTAPVSGSAQIMSSVDPDGTGPSAFVTPTVVATSTSTGVLEIAAQQEPVPLGVTLAWDNSDGPHSGRLYAAFVDMAEDPAHGPDEPTLFVTYADGTVTNWSTPRRVSLDPAFQSMFLPSIAVDPASGGMAVGWYGTRGLLGEPASATDFYVATSLDGATFSDAQRVSVETSTALDPDLGPAGLERGFGESPGMAFVSGRLYPLWSDNSSLAKENNFEPQFEVATVIVGVIMVQVPPVALKPLPIQAVQGELFDGPVATFTSSDSGLEAGNFTATIQWGDGGESSGLVLQPDGPGTAFQVFGRHTYAETGGYPLWVRVYDIANNIDTEPVRNITAQQGSQAEPTIAIDPSNPDRVFASGVHVNFQFPLGIPVAGSLDGGVTWMSGTLADGTDALPPALGDTRAVFDQFGNLFVTYLTPRPERNIVVLLSTNGGEDFSLLATFTDVDKADQPSIAVGPGESGAGGSVWLTWERGDQPFNVIMAAGAPVTGLGAVGAFNQWLVAPLSADGASRNFGDIAVGPDGQVLLTYTQAVLGGSTLGPAQIVVHLDPDGLGAVPFGPPTVAADIQVGSHLPIPASAQRPIDAEGNLAWDVSDGEHRGRVYLVYTDSPAVGDFNTDIFSRYSDDNGQHWSESIQINDADPNSQFLPSVAVDQSSGNVGVAWYTAVDAANVLTRFTATLSDDGGSTWNRVAYLVSPGDSDATDSSIDLGGQRFQYGDYSGLSFVAGTLQPIWADNSLELDGVPDPRSFDLANARIAVAQVTRAPLVVATFDVEDVEGNEFTQRLASFTDPDGNGSATDYEATIQWGDGGESDHGTVQREADGSFSVLGTHEYEKFGRYSMRVVITGPQTKGDGAATAVIENAPLDLVIPDNLRVVREMEFTKVVATLSDLNRHSTAADFIATIEWGDGTASSATLALQAGSGQGDAPNTFTITGTHKYLSERTFSINVSLLERPSGETLARAGDLISGDPPLDVNEYFLDVEALEGINTGDLVLVTFERADDIEVPLDTQVGAYIATISWGDGHVDTNIIPFMTSEDVTVVGQHTYATSGEYYPSITLVDDSGGFFSVQLIAIVEPDVTSLVRTVGSGLVYDPVSEWFVGELIVTNTSSVDIDGPLYMVFHDLPAGVVLENITVVTGAGDPVYKVDQSRLPAGASLPPIPLEFSNPDRVPISYTIQVFDGLRPEPVGGPDIVFEPNRGQASDAVSFIARGPGYAIGLSAGNVSLVLSGSATQAGAAALMEIVGANASPTGVALDPQPGVSNYLSGDSSITAVPHYGRVRYTEVYAGIDVEYYGRDGLLEYDWIVRPGADPEAIAVRFHGVDGLVRDHAGNLRLQVPGGELVQRAPVVYQIVAGARIEVAAAYELHSDGTIGFTIDAYDRSVALVIDPVLVYSTYLGGNGGESGAAVAVDTTGNTYVTGETGSSDFFTVNPFDPELNQPETSPFWLSFDAFVAKFDPQGVLVYSTYLGGGSTVPGVIRETIGQSIAVDSAGQAWIGGTTRSPLFPTTTSAPSGFEPASTEAAGFLTKLSADGSSILYSSLIRSTPFDLAVDDAGDVYATGLGFALKLDPATNTIRYLAPVFGVARGIAVDGVGQAYVAGFTDSPAFPTKNALFPELHNRRFSEFGEEITSADGFVMKLSADGDVLFATYLGGRLSDVAYDIAVDGFGLIHVVGQTESDDLPVPGGLDTSLGGTHDGFLIRLANDGSSLLYGTYMGGSGSDSVTGVGVDSQGRTYLSGRTDSVDLPTVRAHQPAFGGGPRHLNGSFVYPDGFAASIAADGQSFVYLTYLGGGGFDEVRGVAVDAAGNAAYVGVTNSADLPTRNAAQTRLLGIHTDAFIVRLLAGDAGTITLHNRPFTAVEGSPYNGLVAFFATNGSETAGQFSAIIDWGDGVSSAGTIAGDFRDGFQILGNHVYSDVGAHDVFVTLRDSLGRIVTATSTGAVTAAEEERVLYHVAIDTATWVGTQGLLSFQFNPGAIPGSPDAEARITALNLFDGATGASSIDGDASQASSSEFTLRPSAVLNRLTSNVTLGTRIEFDLELVGPGLSQPQLGDFAAVFALQLFGADGVTSLLDADATASILRVNLDPDGSTHAQSSGAAVTVAASGRATVANAPVTLTLVPFSIQEGLEFIGVVATFTSGNPRESAGEFRAEIDWGDGSPVTGGVVAGGDGNFSVSGAHVYQSIGSYSVAVTVIEPDGLVVGSTTGRSILAAQVFKNDWGSLQFPPNSQPVSGDFNGDGILDVAVGGFWLNPTISSRGVGILLGRGDGSFELGGFQPTGNSAIEIAAADFNNDGKLDVAAAIWNRAESVVELLLGNGDGTLQPSIQLAELKNPGSIAAADFNSDGTLDLAYTESTTPTQNTGSSTLKIALGDGNGTFGAPIATTIRAASNYHVSTTDLDGDAVPDILLASFSSLEFLRGLGDGSFEPPIIIVLGVYASSPAIADLDGDGRQDVAAVDGVTLNIFSGHGDGTFDAPLQIAAPQSSAVVAADFNHDGRPDLATIETASAGRVRVFINDSAGSFAGGVAYEGISNPASILAGDFDRDGHIDLATSGNSAVMSVLPGIGDGTFASAVRYASGLVNPPSGIRAEGVFTADVNGDSHTDAVLLMSDGLIVTQLGNGDGTFQSLVTGNAGLNSHRTPILVDLNGDDLLDLVAPSYHSGIAIVLGRGDGTFPTSQVEWSGGTAVVQGDFNQDGRRDLATVNQRGFGRDVSVYLAKADGTFPAYQEALHYATGGGARSIITGDFNGDARLDLAVANGSTRMVSVLLGNADGTFQAALNIPVGTVVQPFTGITAEAVKAGDFNDDGWLDLVVLGFSGSGLVLPGKGDGTFGDSIAFTTTELSAGRDLAVGDFNGDGKLDIVTASQAHVNFFIPGGGLSVLLGNGDFTFQDAETYADRSVPTAMTLGDFNQDGRLDIASANVNNGTVTSGLVSILLGNPDGTFQDAVNYLTVGANPRSVATGDLDADGILDLAVVNASGDTAILLGNANGTFQPAVNYYSRGDGLLGGPIAAAIDDLNGDGRADVVAGGSLLFGDGDGTFPDLRLFTYLPPVINTDFQKSEPHEIAAGDLNGDGNIDLAVAMRGTSLILFGNGNGSFLPPQRLTLPAVAGLGNHAARIGLADMDGDGDLDVVTLHHNQVEGGGAVAVWRNSGAGVFSTPVVRNVPVPQYDFFGQGVDMELGDLNGDSFVDVVVTDSGDDDLSSTSSGGVSVLMGVGDGTLVPPVRYLLPLRQTAYRATLGDLNRDGRPEIVILTSPYRFGSSRSAVGLFMNKGDGNFEPARIYDFGGSNAEFLATGDFNGDGAADIIIPDSGSAAITFSIIFASDGPVLVTDAPVSVTGMDLNPTAGLTFTATVAKFTDDNPFGVASDFTATIHWGDGHTSSGSVRDNPLGGFEVVGAHTYASTGTFTTTVTVRETGAGTHVGSATAQVLTSDQPLVGTAFVFSAMETLPFTGVVATFTDANPHGSSGDFSARIDWGDGQTTGGAISALATGGFAVIGTHTYAFPGMLPVRVDIADIGGSTAHANSTAEVVPHVNHPPVASDDSYAVQEDTPLAVTAVRGILANDTDADQDTLQTLLVSGPTHGRVTLHPDGSLSYLPDMDFHGIDSFTYRAYDGSANSSVATVNVTVLPVNDAPVARDDFTSTHEDTPLVIDVLTNDTDVDGILNPSSVAIAAPPRHGSLHVTPGTGAVTYTPARDFAGSDMFLYSVKDNDGQVSNIATVLIMVHAVNDAPVAVNDTYLVLEDVRRTVSAAKGVLANDHDPDGDALTALLLVGPAHGALTLNGDGSFTYTPAANYFGHDSFIYGVTDGIAQSAPATVSLAIQSVNDVPSVSLLSDVVIPEGTALALTGSFSDADGHADAWIATVNYGDGSGVQPLALAGTDFTLTRDYPDSGEYITTVTVVDQDGATGSTTFQVTVQNLAPVVDAGADQVTSEGALVTVAATFQDSGIMDTHTAVIDWGDGTGPIAVSVTQTAGSGTLSASHVYADDGVYAVLVTVTDNEGASGSDTVSFAVENRPPVVAAGTDQRTTEGRTVHVLASFTDPGGADSHTAIVDWGDGNLPETARIAETMGAGTAAASHIFLDEGVYTVTVTVVDDDGASDTDTLLITVDNVAPQIEVGPDRTVQEGDMVEFPSPFTIEFLDAAFGTLTFTRVSGSFQDPGVLDTHTAVIDWGDGTIDPAEVKSAVRGGSKVGTVTGSHVYASSGQFIARVIVTDNDGTSNADSHVVSVTSEPPPSETTLSIAAASADQAEGNHGLTPFTFTVARGGDTIGTTTVDFSVSGVGANPADAADFGGLLPAGQASFGPSEIVQTITIYVRGDTMVEPHEAFRVTLSNATGGATITSAIDTGTIRNDDMATGFSLDCSPLQVGLNTCTVLGATPQGVVDLALGVRPGNRYLAQFGVTVGMLDPTIVAQGIVQPDGRAVVQVHVSSAELLERLLFQAFEQAPTPRTTNIVIVGTPLMAAGGQGPGAATLTPSEFFSTLSALRSEAIARWVAAGLTWAESELLRSTSVEVTDLASGRLGQTIGGRLLVDVTAAGYGWFVDVTPQDDGEFRLWASGTEQRAPAGTAAAARMDLLTVLMHEFGHVLGRTDVPAGQAAELMTSTLPLGTRRPPRSSPLDVNRDGTISPRDVLTVINHLNSHGSSRLGDILDTSSSLDVNADGFISPIDALMIINALNASPQWQGEGESAVREEAPTAALTAAAARSASADPALRVSTRRDSRAARDHRRLPFAREEFASQPAIEIGLATAAPEIGGRGSLRDEIHGTLMLDDLLADLAVDTCDRLHRESPTDRWFRHLGR